MIRIAITLLLLTPLLASVLWQWDGSDEQDRLTALHAYCATAHPIETLCEGL